MTRNGIKHIRTAPYHPSSHGQAERFVQTFKRAMKAGAESSPALNTRLSQFLLSYQSIPHATTNISPSELFLKRKIHTRFDALKPDVQSRVEAKQDDQKKYHDQHCKPRQLTPGQTVMVRDFRPNTHKRWRPGRITKQLDGNSVKRFVDHIIPRALNDQDCFVWKDSVNDADHPTVPNTSSENSEEQTTQRYPNRERHEPDRLMRMT